MTQRRSNIVFVVARILVGDRDFFLLRSHPKWGGWSFVGWHVEDFEREDWSSAARREAQEEMVPLQVGVDVALEPLPHGPEQWGPEPSRSAGGIPTVYNAKWFTLRFLRDPEECLRQL